MQLIFDFNKLYASIAQKAFEVGGLSLFILFLFIAIVCLFLYIMIDKDKDN